MIVKEKKAQPRKRVVQKKTMKVDEPSDAAPPKPVRVKEIHDESSLPGVTYNTDHIPLEYVKLKQIGEKFYSPKEVAALLGVSNDTIYRMVSAREILYFTIRTRIQIPERALRKAAIRWDVKGQDAGTHGIVTDD